MKKFMIIVIVFIFLQCHTTVIRLKNSDIDKKELELKQNQTHQISLALGYYEFSEPMKSTCGKEKTNAVVIHRDWKDKIIHILIGGVYSTKSVSIVCETF